MKDVDDKGRCRLIDTTYNTIIAILASERLISTCHNYLRC